MDEKQKISYQEALARGLGRYFTGKPCKRGHVDERLVSNCACMACAREKQSQRYYEDPEKFRSRSRRWYEENTERSQAKTKGWRKSNARRVAEYRSAYLKKNRQMFREKNAQRRARKINATPQWVDRKLIKRVYAQARLAEAVTGWPHHVDHIVPLQGKNVCGLHVPWNLQVLPHEENLEKSNKF